MKKIFALITTTVVLFNAEQAYSDDSLRCSMPRVAEGEATTFTCHFDVNMQMEGQRRDIIMKRETKTEKMAEIIDCYWKGDVNGYYCRVKNSRFYFNYDIGYNATVYLPEALPEDEGKYFCDVTRHEIKTCNFTLNKPVMEKQAQPAEITATTTTTTDDKTEKTTSNTFSGWAIFFLLTTIVLGVFLVAIFASGYCYPSKLAVLPCFHALKNNDVSNKDPSKPVETVVKASGDNNGAPVVEIVPSGEANNKPIEEQGDGGKSAEEQKLLDKQPGSDGGQGDVPQNV